MFSSIAAPVHGFFNNKRVRSIFLSVRVPLFLVAAALVVYFLDPAWFLPSLIVSAVGLVGQLWCFGALLKRKVLAVKGPYAVSRNPMYIARYFLILGALGFTGNIYVLVGFTLIYYFYMVNRVKREEAKLRDVFGQDYIDYCSRIRRYLPTFRGLQWRSLLFFRWEYFLDNNGHWNLLAVAAFYVACFLRVQWK
jgi:protein-S-isoprenylcysteine O-methyltransferase Ste14